MVVEGISPIFRIRIHIIDSIQMHVLQVIFLAEKLAHLREVACKSEVE